MNPETLPSPVVLRNRGVPVDVYRVALVTEADEATGEVVRRWEPVVEGEDLATERRWVRVDANFLADVEEAFGSLQRFMEQLMRRRPVLGTDGHSLLDAKGQPVMEEAADARTMEAHRKALALLWGWDERRVGAAMVPLKVMEYGLAIQTAISIANGVDPTKAARMLDVGLRAARDRLEATMRDLDDALAGMDGAGTEAAATPGRSGSNGGGEPDGDATSSGPQAPPRSSSTSTPGPTPTAPSGRDEAEPETSSNGSGGPHPEVARTAVATA